MGASVLLVSPKYPANLAAVLRACACYGAHRLAYSGDRMSKALASEDRLPRELRMRDYKTVEIFHAERPFEHFSGCVPVAVEFADEAECLTDFQHPDNALYVFGPEDGSLNRVATQLCHRFVKIPTMHCLNLSMAVGTVLYDRHLKRQALSQPESPSQ